jgi:oxygen-independent coproporphyrinogen III oxidase
MTPCHAGLYVHIPFCRAKCAYCDFCSYAGLDPLFAGYVHAVCQEVTSEAPAWSEVSFDTCFIGGGTPTVLDATQLATILETCQRELCLASEGTEVTIEANPGTVTLAGLRTLRGAGVNRLSLGVQSLDDTELRLLGRIHSAADVTTAYGLARQAGFENISLDLIFGLPGQRLARWRETLGQVIALAPEHLSLYALSVEEDTPLAQRIADGLLPAPDDDQAADMYTLSEELLDGAGYVHYEISNWARRSAEDVLGTIPRLACQHNLKYWHNEPYLGLGAAACSYDGKARYTNLSSPAEYIARLSAGQGIVTAGEETFPEREMGETMMLGLRLMVGVSHAAFQRRFGQPMSAVYGVQIEDLVTRGLLLADEQGVRLTAQGCLLGNHVFMAFLP